MSQTHTIETNIIGNFRQSKINSDSESQSKMPAHDDDLSFIKSLAFLFKSPHDSNGGSVYDRE